MISFRLGSLQLAAAGKTFKMRKALKLESGGSTPFSEVD
jgi:hypothetical protein